MTATVAELEEQLNRHTLELDRVRASQAPTGSRIPRAAARSASAQPTPRGHQPDSGGDTSQVSDSNYSFLPPRRTG